MIQTAWFVCISMDQCFFRSKCLWRGEWEPVRSKQGNNILLWDSNFKKSLWVSSLLTFNTIFNKKIGQFWLTAHRQAGTWSLHFMHYIYFNLCFCMITFLSFTLSFYSYLTRPVQYFTYLFMLVVSHVCHLLLCLWCTTVLSCCFLLFLSWLHLC